MVALLELIHVAHSIHSITEFIEGGAFLEALSAIGDTETHAAFLAMSNAKIANDYGREVTLAVGHLQSAHVAYQSMWQRFDQLAGRVFKPQTAKMAMQKDKFTLALMALCYVYLHEPALARGCVQPAYDVEKAEHALSDTEDAINDESILMWVPALARLGATLITDGGGYVDKFRTKLPDIRARDLDQAISQY